MVIAEDGVVVDLVDGKVADRRQGRRAATSSSTAPSVGDITETSLKDRRILGEEGFISVIVVVDSVTGKVVGGPEIHARGFVEDDSVFDEIKPPIVDALDKRRCRGRRRHLPAAADDPPGHRAVGQPNTHRRRPMIIPVVIEA